MPGKEGEALIIPYDYLVNATGPKLAFEATPGLGPKGHTLSVCTAPHAEETALALDEEVARMRRGERQRFLVGTGHGTCTCQGAAFEYIVNLEFELRARGVRDQADITYLSNEYELGDFGMGGIHIRRGGYVTPSNIFTESLFAERGLAWVTQAHVTGLEAGRAHLEFLDGREGEERFDLAMLLPPFKGVGLKAVDRAGGDLTDRLFAPSGFMKVDADYTPKPYETWRASDWPRTYQSSAFPDIFAAGIAFAPPHPVSRPRQSPKGTNITPGPAPHRHAQRHHRQDRGPQHRGPGPGREGAPAHRIHGRDGRRLRGLGGRQPLQGHRGLHHRLPHCPGLRALPRLWPGPPPHLRRDRPGRALDQDPPPPPLHPQGQAARLLVPHPGVDHDRRPTPFDRSRRSQAFFATQPTALTRFLRTFIPGRWSGSWSST